MPKMPSMPSARTRSTPSKLKRSDSSSGAGILTCVLVVISLVLFTLSVREGDAGVLNGVRGVAQTVVAPLRFVGAAVTSPFAGMSNIMRNLTADEKTLSDLKAENERLASRNAELEEAQITAQQLQSLLDIRSTYNLQSTAARVIAGSTDSWNSTVTIDKGSTSGLVVGMPVVDGNGAIGQIIACDPVTSTVRLLTDEDSSVSAMIQKSRAQGMLQGSPDGTLRLSFIRTDQTVDVGDTVVTSGLGGVFPKGIPLGKIASVESTPGSTYYTLVVEPASTASSFEEVLVVTSLTEEQEASATDIDEADAADLNAASGQKVNSESEDSSKKDEEGSESKQDAETNESESEKGDAEDESSSSMTGESATSSRSSGGISTLSTSKDDEDSQDAEASTDEDADSTPEYVSPRSSTKEEG